MSETFDGRDESWVGSTVLVNFTNHTCVGKAAISNHERGVVVTKINGRENKEKRSTAKVYFAMRTSKVGYQVFSLRKVMGPTRIYGCMKRVGRDRWLRTCHDPKLPMVIRGEKLAAEIMGRGWWTWKIPQIRWLRRLPRYKFHIHCENWQRRRHSCM